MCINYMYKFKKSINKYITMVYFNCLDNLSEITKKYKKLILENHPDKGGNTSIFQKINEEYESIKLYKSRNSFLEKKTGNDIIKNTHISIEQLFTGTTIEILYEINKYNILVGYHKTNKSIKLTLPPFFYKNKLVYEEEGDEIEHGTPGKLIVNILIKKDENYHINKLDINYKFNITIKEALIGFEKLLKHPNGLVLKIYSCGCIKPGDIKIFRKQGLKSVDEDIYGDFIVVYNIIFPEFISKHDIRLLEKLEM